MHHPSLLDILGHIPLFVWGILAFILVMGLRQTRTTAMTARRLMILPLAWFCFGAWGVDSAFGLVSAAGLAWVLGLAGGVAAVRALKWPGNARFDDATQRFVVPGSWVPLGLMLGIFTLKFASGMSLALHPEIARHLSFAVGSSAVFGLFSGAFLGRSINILGARPRALAAVAA
ncbi:hypothetical protein CDN99_09370 [Roseateles aquatilis]|uniref:DUF1453 domain-containing protein n=1 Tax=Roseateles aquatilis TaxID=431061 RepID=A0A246JFB0_9BURK|nr:DUF6622 family protein [Roseateles aquatilis]OWQ91366.1 hypothetical protein CDN99_09370 [Roseateles aquatilis]